MYAMVDDLGEGFSVVRDEDEFPILLVPGDEIPLHLWQQAMEHSVIMLVRSDDGRAIMAEEFQGEREEVVSRRAFRVTRWRTDLAFPTVRGYVVGDLQPGQDPATIEVKHEGGFVHLHTHTEYSQLDGLSTVDEIFQTVVDQGGNAVGCADHGNCAVHPDYQLAAKKYGIKPVFGIVAGCVCDTGGSLTHAAIVSREYGIPCVVGTAAATSVIKTGDRIRVDGRAGTVTVIRGR